MCIFFSCCSNGRGKLLYFDAKARAALREDNPKNYEPDSHTSIANYHGYPGAKEDQLNKYEYNPLTQKFIIDQINAKDDSVTVEKKLRDLDFKTIVPELIIKPIVNPLAIERSQEVTEVELALLKEWVSIVDTVRLAVRNAVWLAVGDAVRNTVVDTVRDTVRDAVWDTVSNAVWLAVRYAVRYAVRDAAWDAVRYAVWGYISGFYDINQWKISQQTYSSNPFQCCVDLWEAGLVPSYDGKVWRLHAGPKADIVWEGTL